MASIFRCWQNPDGGQTRSREPWQSCRQEFLKSRKQRLNLAWNMNWFPRKATLRCLGASRHAARGKKRLKRTGYKMHREATAENPKRDAQAVTTLIFSMTRRFFALSCLTASANLGKTIEIGLKIGISLRRQKFGEEGLSLGFFFSCGCKNSVYNAIVAWAASHFRHA